MKEPTSRDGFRNWAQSYSDAESTYMGNTKGNNLDTEIAYMHMGPVSPPASLRLSDNPAVGHYTYRESRYERWAGSRISAFLLCFLFIVRFHSETCSALTGCRANKSSNTYVSSKSQNGSGGVWVSNQILPAAHLLLQLKIGGWHGL